MTELLNSIAVNYLGLVYSCSLLGLILAIFSDQLQLLAKYNGSVQKRIAHGYNRAMKIMILNRAGAVLYFLFIAFCVDHGLSPYSMSIGFVIAIASVAIPSCVTFHNFNKLRSNRNSILTIKLFQVDSLFVASCLATIFNLIGLTFPWIAGASHPEMRLTLANTSFLFNTIYSVINVFYIEQRLAKLVDADGPDLSVFVSGVLFSRILAFIFVAIGLGIYSWSIS